MTEAAVFAVEDALWDEFPYAPYVPAGRPTSADPGDRRVIGRRGDTVLSITDLPAHWVSSMDPPGHARAFQHFAYGADFVAWIVETCRGTRFTTTGAALPVTEQFVLAVQGVRAGLAWDLDGNVLVDDAARIPLGTPTEVISYRVVPADYDSWSIVDVDARRALSEPETGAVLAVPVYDVGTGDDLFGFQARRVL